MHKRVEAFGGLFLPLVGEVEVDLPISLRESRFCMAYSYPYSCKEPDDEEAMMQMNTPLHAEHQLDQLAGQFAHWRQTRSHAHDRIPAHLWDQAVALSSTLSASRVAKHLRWGGQRSQTTHRQTPRRRDNAETERTRFS